MACSSPRWRRGAPSLPHRGSEKVSSPLTSDWVAIYSPIWVKIENRAWTGCSAPSRTPRGRAILARLGAVGRARHGIASGLSDLAEFRLEALRKLENAGLVPPRRARPRPRAVLKPPPIGGGGVDRPLPALLDAASSRSTDSLPAGKPSRGNANERRHERSTKVVVCREDHRGARCTTVRRLARLPKASRSGSAPPATRNARTVAGPTRRRRERILMHTPKGAVPHTALPGDHPAEAAGVHLEVDRMPVNMDSLVTVDFRPAEGADRDRRSRTKACRARTWSMAHTGGWTGILESLVRLHALRENEGVAPAFIW